MSSSEPEMGSKDEKETKLPEAPQERQRVEEPESQLAFCRRCGKEVYSDAVVCPHCGVALGTAKSAKDGNDKGLNILAFLIPIVGLILFLVYKDDYPVRSDGIRKWMVRGFIVGAVCVVVYAILVSVGASILMRY